ncbi:type II secretion system F family protein [Nocardioides bruguierae]|uniref:Type II secretion system F family protein n=1 Tax=Nocardioides bruguierae TaxID=2945102 RepID=A0A9X2DAL3_9ACTN|nr:type II secretion system F family protein [Nocardioides bruguierae]MCM0622377.1 type II secretion system F family protein [Nocardioides bruguierae]
MTAQSFEYKVRDADGKFREGKVKAASAEAVADRLRSLGYVPLQISKAGQGLQTEIKLPGSKRVPPKELAIATRQLATMVQSGLPLLRCLAILSDQVEHPELARVLGEVRAGVEAGHSLSSSLQGEPRTFPPLMINMVRAGELGGFLDTALAQVAETLEAEVRLRAKVKSAMTYPVVVLVMAALMCIGMLLFIVPVFEKMFTDLGGVLPLPTRILVFLSDAMVFILPALAIGTFVCVVWWRRNGHERRVREVVDPLKLKMPVFGDLAAKIALARFSRNLGTLLGAGVPILQALDIVGDTSGSTVIAHATEDVRRSVAGGQSIAGPLGRHEIFPSMVVQMIASGEESGAVDVMLGRIATFYDEEVEATTEALTSLIEPLLIAGLGLVVGGMIVALYMPIFSVFDLIQ